jgi:hypothetical protein
MLVLALVAAAQSAEVPMLFSGNELQRMCASRKLEGEYLNKGLCAGFIAGVVDMASSPSTGGVRICAPPKVTIGQYTDIVANFLDAHPEVRHYTGASIVRIAIAQAFPCGD